MNRKVVLVGFIALCCWFQGYGQKIKYKDLIILLNAKQFDEAEPFLKKYLKDNDDNPSAYLFMGMIFQEKSIKMDPLKQTTELISQIDSAILFYQKASKGITEKEVSRNEEYYEMYNRRDLRTGKFGIKLSDVQLDIENRMKLKDRAKVVASLKAAFVLSQEKYEKTRQLFTAVSGTYPSSKELYLRADEKLHADLTSIAVLYDSCHIAFNDYKGYLKQVGRTPYNQDLDPEDIRDFKRDGLTPADFFHDDLKIWDYKRWAVSTIETLEKEITPIKDQLVALDVEINKLQHQLKTDSVSVRTAIPGIKAKTSFPALSKIDPHPMPLRLFAMKISELDYGSLVVENKSLRDSASILAQVEGLKKELYLLRQIDTLARAIDPASIDEEVENYKHFVTTAFGTPVVLKSQVKATLEFALRESGRRELTIKQKEGMLKWIISAPDSIPLFTEVSAKSRFRPLIINPEAFTVGLDFKDSIAHGYFYMITPSRKAELKSKFAVDSISFTKRSLPYTKAISTQDDKGHVYFVAIYSEVKVKEKFPVTIAKFYQSDGLSWDVNLKLDQMPFEVVYSTETSELSIKTKTASGDLVPITLDKNGKIVK